MHRPFFGFRNGSVYRIGWIPFAKVDGYKGGQRADTKAPGVFAAVVRARLQNGVARFGVVTVGQHMVVAQDKQTLVAVPNQTTQGASGDLVVPDGNPTGDGPPLCFLL